MCLYVGKDMKSYVYIETRSQEDIDKKGRNNWWGRGAVGARPLLHAILWL